MPRLPSLPRLLRENRTVLAGCIVGTLAVGSIVACTTDYQKGLDDPNYGGPKGLLGETPPGPAAGDGGAGSSGSSGGSTTQPLCVSGGEQLTDGGACAVSFATDILGIFKTAGCNGTGCHATDNPPPKIDPAAPKDTWVKFSQFKLSQGQYYINPCSTDVNKSGMACNLYPSGPTACGVHMPYGGGQLSQDDITKVETWVKCGAPNN